MKPLIMAHKGISKRGDKENSLNAIKQSLKFHPDTIELDIRKSKDNVLFCYHGTNLEYIFDYFIFRNKSFSDVKKKHPTIKTFDEIADTVGNKAILFLDIKDYSLKLDEIVKVLKNKKIKDVWIASQNLVYLKNIKKLPKNWKKVHNGFHILTKSNLKKFKQAKLDVVELVHWSFNKKNISLLNKNHIKTALSSQFMSRKNYIKKAISESSLWVWDYNLNKLKRIIRTRR